MNKFTNHYAESSTDLTHDNTGNQTMHTKRLSTNELHEYGFVAEILKIYNIQKKPHLVEIYLDWVERGDKVIYLKPECEILPPACFAPDSGLPRGRFVGVRDSEIWVALNDQKPPYHEMCQQFDQATE